MPCYKPLTGWYGRGGVVTFDPSKAIARFCPISIGCGRCIGCLLEKAKEWALRCIHEAQMHDASSFITLTYSSDHLPADHGLHHIHFQKFIRALRQSTKTKIRYFMCGEYGKATAENNYIARPHFHAILFGYDFPDKYLWRVQRGNRIYRSPTLERHWQRGNSEIGNVTFESAGYVARYCLKKQHGETGKREYAVVDFETGELTDEQRRPPYIKMSLKPGLGESWFHKYKTDLFPHDFAVLPDGRKSPVPAYYRKLLEKHDPDLAAELRAVRIEKARQDPNNTEERLQVREFVKIKQTERLKREL